MLAKFFLLAGAMQAALAAALIEDSDGKPHLPISVEPGHNPNTPTRHHMHHNHGHGDDQDHDDIGDFDDDLEPFNGTAYDSHHNSLSARGVGGKVVLANRCYYDIWVWSVSEGYSSPPIHVKARSQYREPKRAPAAGGVVLKVSRSNQLLAGKQTQFEYAIANNVIYYDISFVDCATGKSGKNCPGWRNGLSIKGINKKCRTVNCPKNKYCPHAAYFVDTPVQKLGIAEPVYGCGNAGAGMDLHFRMCSGNKPVTKRSVAGRVPLE